MVDPFFKQNENTKNQNVDSNQTTNNSGDWSVDISQQIKELNLQQEQIQEKYKELKSLYETHNLDLGQKEQIQEQMWKLSTLYTQNKQTLATLTSNISGEKQIQINKDVVVKTKKTGKKISMTGILLWCGVLFLFLVGWLALIFYYLIQNPSQLSGVGIDPNTAIQLLQIFAIVFFGLLFFASLGVLIVNSYRLINSKNKSKIPYVFGVLLWFIVFLFTLFFGARILNTLNNLEVGSLLNPNQLIIARVILKNDVVNLASDPRLVTIAPINISYDLNTSLFQKQIVPRLWNVQNISITLDCWNWKVLPLNGSRFVGACFYQKKWDYPVKLNINYVNAQTSEKLSENLFVWNMEIKSQITLTSNKWDVKLWNNELIVGTNPVKLTMDAGEIFRDFQLSEYKIIWDADGDGAADKSDFTIYTHLYTGAGVYNITVRFPGINNYLYTFPVRIEQSDVPVAYVNYNQISQMEYNIVWQFYGVWPDISEYVFNILDKQTNKTIDTISSKTPNITYTFPWNGVYAVQMVFVTQEWKQGTAESENIEVWWAQFQIFYDISIKTPTKPSFQKLENLENIEIAEIPTVFRLEIKNILPALATAQTQVYVDGSPIVSTNNIFQTTIDDTRDYNIKIVVTDPNRGITTEKDIRISVKRDDIVWKLLISPDVVGTSPFTVKFDASTTTLNDPSDQIVYFSWDFGDGNKKPNTSQSIINHTYTYDFENENGVFYPKVTVKTKKWRELLIWSGTMISVKKPTATLAISLDSHPTQFAMVWDRVRMSLNVSGLPEKIVWDFGNWNKLECKWRECTDTSQVYDIAWDYTISVEVTYLDRPSIDWKINLKVSESR